MVCNEPFKARRSVIKVKAATDRKYQLTWVTDMGFKEKIESIVLLPQNRLDANGGISLQKQFAAIDAKRYGCWLIDMSLVDFVDSAGLVALVTGLKMARRSHCKLAICNPTPAVRLILEITRLDQALEVMTDRDIMMSASTVMPAPTRRVDAELVAA
jgi:anti-anti-sigma factor